MKGFLARSPREHDLSSTTSTTSSSDPPPPSSPSIPKSPRAPISFSEPPVVNPPSQSSEKKKGSRIKRNFITTTGRSIVSSTDSAENDSSDLNSTSSSGSQASANSSGSTTLTSTSSSSNLLGASEHAVGDRPAIFKEGYLTKEGYRVKSWKTRWCTLRHGAIIYSKAKDSPPLGRIDLINAKWVKESKKSRSFCFEVQTLSRTYYLAAATASEESEWIKCITEVMTLLLGRQSVTNIGDGIMTQEDPSNPETIVHHQEGEKPLTPDDFIQIEKIGQGTFGSVWKVKKKDTETEYAMKILRKKLIVEKGAVEHTKTEQHILKTLRHPFLVGLHFSFQTSDKIFFIMDLISGGHLYYHLKKAPDGKFTEPQARFYASEILLALQFLHEHAVVYRDLKPENILLTSEGHICMTDFGSSKETEDRTRTFCGTPEYIAPEILLGKDYHQAVDWWSFGTVLFEILLGRTPFYAMDLSIMYDRIMNEKVFVPKSLSLPARDLLRRLLESDPDKRLTDPIALRTHKWFLVEEMGSLSPDDLNTIATSYWEKVYQRGLTPPLIPPPLEASSEMTISDLLGQNSIGDLFDSPQPISAEDMQRFPESVFNFTKKDETTVSPKLPTLNPTSQTHQRQPSKGS